MKPSKHPIQYLGSRSLLVLLAGVAGVGLALVLAHIPMFIAVSLLPLTCGLWLMQKSVGVFNLRALTIPAFCYLHYIAAVLIASFFVFEDHPGPFRATFLFSVDSALLTIPLGILLTNRIFQFRRRETAAFFRSSVEDNSEVGPEIFLVLLLFALVLTCSHLSEVRTIPLLYLLKHPGEVEYLGWLREQSSKLLNSPLAYVYSLLDTTLYPFLVLFSFGRYLQSRRTLWAALFWASFLPGVLYAGFTIAKAPVALLILSVGLYYYLYRGGRVGAKFVLLLVLLVFAFPLFEDTRQYAGQADFMTVLLSIGRRTFYTPAEVLYYYFEIFPHVVPYQHGLTIGKLAMLFGTDPFDSANFVGRYMRPNAGFSISANGAFLGNLNADFGLAGVLLGGVLAGVIMQASQIYLVRRGKFVGSLVMYAVFVRSFAGLSSTALPNVMLSNGPIFILLLVNSMTLLQSMLESALRTRRPSFLWGRSRGEWTSRFRRLS